MPQREQNYRNHGRVLPAFHFFVLPVLSINVLVMIALALGAPSLRSAWDVIVATALVCVALLSRTQALTVQDRVIRLEMRQRFARVLPPELQSRADGLTTRQLIGLRFASDAELPQLCRDVLEGRLRTGKEIKLRVKDWQADWLRA